MEHAAADPTNDALTGSLQVIYDTSIVLDMIKNGATIDIAAGIALALVSEKAHELGMVEEWVDLWGRQQKGQRRRGGGV